MKFLARSLGLLLVAAGFVGLVIDGTRSIVNNAISFTSVAGMINSVFPAGVTGLQAKVTAQLHPVVWDPVLVHLVQLPASVTAFFIGAFLLWLGQKPLEPIGYLAGR
ncbi:PetM family of cytochrome b6f complex subunit 7 [Microvirga antarctica]|uniref:PetM family of cytochrome b6f complex subunit 7 n=1 Tax=Microvirga antarctica TaxID=2819233 RepID=UPI001B305AAD|nr:PetM family of cytochrome b6f complex subunit 7 [Microvirga antarctica]